MCLWCAFDLYPLTPYCKLPEGKVVFTLSWYPEHLKPWHITGAQPMFAKPKGLLRLEIWDWEGLLIWPWTYRRNAQRKIQFSVVEPRGFSRGKRPEPWPLFFKTTRPLDQCWQPWRGGPSRGTEVSASAEAPMVWGFIQGPLFSFLSLFPKQTPY